MIGNDRCMRAHITVLYTNADALAYMNIMQMNHQPALKIVLPWIQRLLILARVWRKGVVEEIVVFNRATFIILDTLLKHVRAAICLAGYVFTNCFWINFGRLEKVCKLDTRCIVLPQYTMTPDCWIQSKQYRQV